MKYKLHVNLIKATMANQFGIHEPMVLIDVRYFPPGFNKHNRAYQGKFRMADGLSWRVMLNYLHFIKRNFIADLEKDPDLQSLLKIHMPKHWN